MWDSTTESLYYRAEREEGVAVADSGALVCLTGKHTGRAPNDKFIVDEPSSRSNVGWGEVNRPISEGAFERLLLDITRHLFYKRTYSQNVIAGADLEHCLPVRVFTETAWHALATRHLLTPAQEDNESVFTPGMTIFHAPDFRADPKKHETNSDAFIAIHFGAMAVVIGGTGYFGEIKKSVFTAMNYLLPEQGVLPMHCSANIGPKGDTALFFGLSGTGKTTLSADGSRRLIGDDEHGWSDKGIFNFEGGCYAKTFQLSEENEPEIWRAVNSKGAVIENVCMDPETGKIDFNSDKITENGRAAYPIEYLDTIERSGMGGHPENTFILTCDAFGVMPPIAKLTPEQAVYHFLSGYTAKVAGTESGIKEPKATFSECHGAPFMPRPPEVYAKLLGEKIKKHNVNCWLLNTGWSGGSYGVGRRMEISVTRALLRAALCGKLDNIPFERDPYFGLSIPAVCPGVVPHEILRPHLTWDSEEAYRQQAQELIGRFRENFKRFGTISKAIQNAAPGI